MPDSPGSPGRGLRIAILAGLTACAVHPAPSVSGVPENGHAAPSHTARHESASAIVHHEPDDALFARRVAEILDYARSTIGVRYGEVPGRVRVHLYATNEAMSEGVRSVLGYRDYEAAAVVRVGASQVEQGTLHLHRRLATWGETLWHVLIDEYVQGVTEAKFGAAPKLSATWIDEGLSSYLACDVLDERFPRYAAEYRQSMRKTAFRALVLGSLPSLADASDRERWFRTINTSVDAWRNEYAKADVSVAYIVDTYGMESLTAILRDVSGGSRYSEAIYREIGITDTELERRIHASLFLSGVFVLYRAHAMAVLFAVSLGIVLLWLWWRKRS